MIKIKSTQLLTAILLISLTVSSQTSSNDSIKCFTYSQVRKITKEIKKGQLCDSISQLQELQIINFKDVLKKDNLIIKENNERLLEVTKELNATKTKLRISTRLTFFGVPIALGGGFLLGIILVN